MMTSLPNEEYIRACKLVEAFGIFFEKISLQSTNPTKNLEALIKFKQTLYGNLGSQEKLAASVKSFCGDIIISPHTLPRSQSSKTAKEANKSVPKSSLQVPAYNKSKSEIQIEGEVVSEKLEEKQVASQEGFFSDRVQQPLATEDIPISHLMSKVKSVSHNEIAKLFALGSNYSYARSFNDNRQPILVALCFSFLEKVLKSKAKSFSILESQLNNDPELFGIRGTELFGFIKGLLQNYDETEILRKLYDHSVANSKSYQSTINIFRKMILESLPRKTRNTESATDPLDWLNDIDTVDTSLLQNLTKIFRIPLRFLVLTKDKLIERVALPDNENSLSKYDSPRERNEVHIFYDKNVKAAYILYPNERLIEEESKSNIMPKNKARPSSNGRPTEPSMESDLPKKSQKASGPDQRGGSLTTLDTLSPPVASVNEIDNTDSQSNSKQPIPHFDQIRKINPFEAVMRSSRDSHSTPLNRGGSITEKSSLERNIFSPQRCSQDTKLPQYKEVKEFDFMEERLTPKEKESAPRRPTYIESERPSIDERLSIERQGSGTEFRFIPPIPELRPHLSAPKKDEGRFFNFGRSATQEFSNTPSSAGLKFRDQIGFRANVLDMSWKHRTFKVEEPAIKITKVPGSIQTKVDTINQISSQCEEEFDGLVNRYLRQRKPNGVNLGPVKPLGLLSNTYNAIVSQNKENSVSRTVTGFY